MRGSPLVRGRGLMGTAVAGVVVGHGVTYALALADPRVRHAVLEETGHGYWSGALAGAALLAVWVVASVIVRTTRRRPAAGRPATTISGGWMLRLAGTQVLLFAALETIERLLSGASPATLLDHGILWVGLLVQIVTAIAVSLVLAAVGRAVELVLSRSPRARRSSAHLRAPATAAFRPVAVLVGSGGVRAPPPR